MKRPSTQTLLKGALLVVLASNINWPTVMTVTSMSSESQPTMPNLSDVPVVTDPPPPAPTTPSSGLQTKPFYRNICGDRYSFVFVEVTSGNQTKTELVASPGSGTGALGRIVPGRLIDVLADDNAKTGVINQLIGNVKDRRHCQDPAGSSAAVDQVVFVNMDSANGSDDDQLQDDIKNCIRDRSGRTLSSAARMSCDQHAFDKLSNEDTGDDRDKRDQLKTDLTNVVHRLEKDIKSLLISSDDSDIDDGSQRVSDLISSIQDLDNDNVDTQTKTHLINELTAMRTGAATRRAALDFDDRSSDLSDRFKTAYSNYQQVSDSLRNLPQAQTPAGRLQAQALLQQAAQPLAELYNEHKQLSLDVDTGLGQDLQDLQTLQRQNALSSADMHDYLSPYNTLKNSLVQMIDPSAMGYSNLLYVPRDPYFGGGAATPGAVGLNLSALLNQQNGSVQQAIMQDQQTMQGQSLPYTGLGNYGLQNGSTLGFQQGNMPMPLTTNQIFTPSIGPTLQPTMVVGNNLGLQNNGALGLQGLQGLQVNTLGNNYNTMGLQNPQNPMMYRQNGASIYSGTYP